MKEQLYRQLLANLEQSLTCLPDKPDETPQNTLDCLIALASGQPLALSQLAEAEIGELSDQAVAELQRLVACRLAGVPLAHLTGRQDFMGLALKASKAALVPRRETEILGWAAVAKIRESETDHPLVVDLCTGSGNLALAMAVHAPRARVWGSDLSEEAVALARDNARFIGRPEVNFLVGDLTDPFDHEGFLGRIDVLTCNPPYISSGKVDTMPPEIAGHEPRLAFDGGPFGVRIVQKLVKEAPRLLRPGGWLLFEVGLGQGKALQQRLERHGGFSQVTAYTDNNGEIRALAVAVIERPCKKKDWQSEAPISKNM